MTGRIRGTLLVADRRTGTYKRKGKKSQNKVEIYLSSQKPLQRQGVDWRSARLPRGKVEVARGWLVTSDEALLEHTREAVEAIWSGNVVCVVTNERPYPYARTKVWTLSWRIHIPKGA